MSRTLQPEDRIAHYRVVGPLGAGGMGEVYIARDSRLDRSVALKVLPQRLVRNEERVRRFITEAKSASSLNHPNIVTIYEIGEDQVRSAAEGDGPEPGSDPVHFISMELISGDTLSRKIHEEKTDFRTLLGWLAQAAEGIAKAHAAGIVHRDLKPGNIMISKDGFAKVLDFGLAKLTEKQPAPAQDATNLPTDVAPTGVGVVMGTVGYMSPEQVQARAADHRSDIFSMGCILYEAATRRRPFTADTDVEVMHQILRDRPTPVEELNPEVPAEARRIIRRCLAKSPDQRFQSMKDLAIELRELVEEYDSLSATATSASSPASVPSGVLGTVPGRRTGLIVVVTAAVAVGLAGLSFGIYSLLGRGGSSGSSGAGLQDMRMSVLMSRADLTEAVLSADGRYLAYITTADGRTSLTVRQVRTGSDVKIIPAQEYQARGVSFSPDGDYLYYLNRDPNLPNYSALFQVPSLGGTPRRVIFDVDSGATFSPDGRRVCFRRGLLSENADSLVVADPEGGNERELIRVKRPEGFVAAPAWSPDGTTILAAIQSSTGGFKTRLAAVNVETGAMKPIGTKYWVFVNSAAWVPDGSAVFAGAFELGASTAPQIYRVSYPDGVARRLTNDLDGYANISLSADGSSLAAIRRAEVNNLWVADVDKGKEAEPITFASGSSGSLGLLAPLPGGAVAFTAPRDAGFFLWRVARDGSDRRQLTSQGVFVQDAAYTREAGLVFSQVDGGEKVLMHVWRVDPDGGGLRQLTTGEGEQVVHVAPSGSVALFRKWNDPRAIWAVPLAGGDPSEVARDVVDLASLSPDGKRVLIARLEGAEGQNYPRRYIISVEGGEPTASFLLPPGALDIKWTPDGQALTYVDRAQGWNLMRKTLPDGEPKPLTRFTDGHVVDHDWHPDGSRMVLHRRVAQQDSLWMLASGEADPSLIVEFKTGRTIGHLWAPDEPVLYFTYGTSTQDVVLIKDFR